MKYLTIFLFIILLGCENIKQSIGITTKPFQSGESFANASMIGGSIVTVAAFELGVTSETT